MIHPKFGLASRLILFLISVSTLSHGQQIENGILDLRGRSISNLEEVDLNGQWGFFWGEFMNPESDNAPTKFISVPGSWNDFKVEDTEIGADGYATYVLDLLFDDSINNLGLDLTSISTAYELYVNGELISSAGTIGKTPESVWAQYKPEVVFFNATPRTRLLFHVSNFDHRVGGIRDELVLGKPDKLIAKRELFLMASVFLCGCFFIMGMYHLVLYFIQKQLSPLVFSVFCMILTLRVLITGNIPVSVISDIGWTTLIRYEYFTFFMSIFLFLIFFASLFRRFRIKSLEYVMLGYLGLMTLLVFITQPRFFTTLLVYTQVLVFVAAIYSIYILVNEYRVKNREAIIFAVGYVFILFTVINDILFVHEYIETGHMYSLGLFLFLGTQAALLSRRYSASFSTNKVLLQELNQVNQGLEDKVLKRTSDLNVQNEALEEQNIQITSQNHELRKLNSELDRFVYSVSHDLKAPIASMLGLVQISENEEDIKTLKSYLAMMSRSLNKQSEFITDILDYSKNRRLELNRDQINFAELINRVLEQHEFIENWSNINKTVEVDQSGEFVSDLQRISIILNNLIANALKYSNTSTAEPEVKVKVQVDSQRAKVVIEDNGCGIDEEHHEKIFDMFYRADDRMHGSGLGLYIVSETLIKLSGDISLRSARGAGTTITITLPNNSNTNEKD